jgi:hypothetical protein
MMSNYLIAVYVSFWSWHIYGSHSVYLPKPGATKGDGQKTANVVIADAGNSWYVPQTLLAC